MLRFYHPNPRLEFSKDDMQDLLAELHKLGFGHELRTKEKAAEFPTIDELAFTLEAELGLVKPRKE